MKILDISFLKTVPNWPQNLKKRKLGFRGSVFKKTDFGGLETSFTRCLIHKKILVKPKPNQKRSFFAKNRTENRTEVIFC